MSEPILTRLVGRVVDERFLNHRQRSMALGGMVGGVLASLLFGWRFYVDRVWSWDLLAVAGTIVVVKLGTLAWLRLRD